MLHSEVRHFKIALDNNYVSVLGVAYCRYSFNENRKHHQQFTVQHEPSILATLISESRSNMTKRNLIYGVVISPLITKGKSMLRQIVFTERDGELDSQICILLFVLKRIFCFGFNSFSFISSDARQAAVPLSSQSLIDRRFPLRRLKNSRQRRWQQFGFPLRRGRAFQKSLASVDATRRSDHPNRNNGAALARARSRRRSLEPNQRLHRNLERGEEWAQALD